MTPEIDVLDFSDDRDEEPFVLRSYDLADAFGCTYADAFRDNYGAQDKVRSFIKGSYPALFSRVSFDSEMGCFFAYTQTEEDALSLRCLIFDLLGLVPTEPEILRTDP